MHLLGALTLLWDILTICSLKPVGCMAHPAQRLAGCGQCVGNTNHCECKGAQCGEQGRERNSNAVACMCYVKVVASSVSWVPQAEQVHEGQCHYPQLTRHG